MDLEKRYFDSDGYKRDIQEMVNLEPEWAANRIQAGEKAIERVRKLIDYILNLGPYCNNCEFEGRESPCDDCHRKMFHWQHKEEIKLP